MVSHIPGYQGYVPSVKSENLFAESFAKTSNKSIEQNVHKGFDINGKEKYNTVTRQTFQDQMALGQKM